MQPSFDFVEPRTHAEAIWRINRDLPDGEAALITAGRAALKAYHEAVIGGVGADRHAHQLEAIAIKMNGGSNAAMAIDDGGAVRLDRALAATPGKVPMHGQKGAFIVQTRGCRIIVEIPGLFGIPRRGGSLRALDYDRPFISEAAEVSGYRSVFNLTDDPKPGESVKALVMRHLKKHFTQQYDFRRNKYVPTKLVAITKGGGYHKEVWYCDECYHGPDEDSESPEALVEFFYKQDPDGTEHWHHGAPGKIREDLDADHTPYCENGPDQEWVELPAGPPKDDPDWQEGGWIANFLKKHPLK